MVKFICCQLSLFEIWNFFAYFQYQLLVDDNATAYSVKKALSQQTGVPPNQVRICNEFIIYGMYQFSFFL